MTSVGYGIPYVFAESPPVEDAHHEPRDRICDSCKAQLLAMPHAQDCPERATILRLNVTGCPQQKRLEDLLQACTTRAWHAWRETGRRA